MGFQERRYNEPQGEGGGFKRALRRIFVEGDNFFSWALPLYRLGGITVRVHIFYIVFVISKLIWPIDPGVVGFAYTAYFLAAGFLFVLLHEYGHCIACRYVGGEAEEIIMWPLGGLAMCRPPHNWRANMITTAAGPAVNLVLAAVLAGGLLALGAGRGVVLFNPFHPWSAVYEAWFDRAAYWKIMLFSAYISNIYLFVFNVFLPMYPMDGGRILQELLWRKMGYKKATRIAANIGMVLAVIVGVFAMTPRPPLNLLFSIAVFAGITCFVERRRLEFIQEDMDQFGNDFSRGYQGLPDEKRGDPGSEQRGFKGAAARQEKEQRHQAEVDRILAKIASQGMGSLSRRERATLGQATERQRGG